ncbi:MAG: flagellar basal body-associated protein FliL [Burkholderiales bacterium]|nr:flagellar basal body-associated protein FliL [Burkholderiales bacterium]
MATTATKQPKTAPKTSAKQEPDAGAEDAAAPKKKRSLLKIALLLTPLLAIAGGGAFYFLQGEQPAAVGKHGAAKGAKAANQEPAKPPVFVTLEPFTVNLQYGDSSSQYLQVGLVLKITDDTVAEAIKLYMPEIRNRVLLLLSSKSASDLATAEGKKTLSTELAHEILQPLTGKVPAKGLDSVLFTSFVIQ